MSAEQWYYEVNGQGYGPISARELKQLADSGLIERMTLVRQGERGQWARADKYRGMFAEPIEQEPPPVIKPPPPRMPATPGFQQLPTSPHPRPAQPAPQFTAQPPQAAPQAVPEAQFVSFSSAPPGPGPKVNLAGAAGRGVTKGPVVKQVRGGGKYDALILVSKIYDVLAWVVLVLGGLGVAGYVVLAIVGAIGSGDGGIAAAGLAVALGGAVAGALYVLLSFVTLRAASQAFLLAIDVEKNTRRSNELLESIRDSLASPRVN